MNDAIPLICDGELAVLNAAQTILERIAEDARKRGYATMRGEYVFNAPTAMDYAQAETLAGHANDAIFDLFNCCSIRIQEIPYRNLHNREPAPSLAPEPDEVPV